jgi:hypothetical protein
MSSWRPLVRMGAVGLVTVFAVLLCVAPSSAAPRTGNAQHESSTVSTVPPAAKSTPSAVVKDALAAAPSCPSNYTCGTVPASCPSGSTCPTYEVGPTSDLGPDQWVYVNLYNWTSTPGTGDFAQINYCSNTAPLPSTQLCANAGGEGIAELTYPTQAFPDGSTQVSYQVEELDTSALPLDGDVPGESAAPAGKFFCDADAPCSVDITDTGPTNSGSQILVPATTAVVPINFAPSTNGCPTADTVNTQSDFGSDLLFPIAARLSCTGPNPTLAFNTAIDGLTAVTSLVSNGVNVAFTDDPEQSDQQAELSQGNFALIPVALSANVVSFTAEERTATHQELVPLDSMDLTPNMAAGLLSGSYEGAATADATPCGGNGCVTPPCTAGTKNKPATTCALMNELNFNSQFLFAQIYGGYVRSDTAGPNGQLFSWLCNAPVKPVSALSNSYTEPLSGAQVLEAGLNPRGKPLKSCPTDEQWPPVNASSGTYLAYSDPSQQALKINTAVDPTIQLPTPQAAFAAMNWGDANYFGMSVAALQNAAGDFVLPTEQSLDAAVADAKTNADGSLTPDYTSTDPNAYPMPSLTYAVVPTRGVTPTQAAQDQAMLTQLLNLTAGADTSDLPAGFVPLPSSLYQEAQADIAQDFASEDAPVPTSSSSSSGSSPGGTSSGGTSGGSSSGSSAAPTSSGGVPSAAAGSSTHRINVVAPPTTPGAQTKGNNVVEGEGTSGAPGSSNKPGNAGSLDALSLASSNSGTLVLLALLLGFLALILGSVMFLSRDVRRHVFEVGSTVYGFIRRTSSAAKSRIRTWLNPARPGSNSQ